jgi:hypothetical protein
MGGRYVRLEPGRYTLAVSDGDGPAGVQRSDGSGVRVDVGGGRAAFQVVDAEERVFYWWRGPEERPGVRLLGLSDAKPNKPKPHTWPTGTTG